MALPVDRRKREQYCIYCGEVVHNGNLARHHKTRHPEIEQNNNSKAKLHGEIRDPKRVSEWLQYCGVDISTCGVPWPLDKLDRLPDLRAQPQGTHDQCIAWQVFKSQETTCLPSLERFLLRIRVEACTDAWRSNDPTRFTSDSFQLWQEELLERKDLNVRILNIPIAEEMVDRGAQDRYQDMVHDKVQAYYGLGANDYVEIHDATANITPRGTATEIHHDSEPHISTACGWFGVDSDQPMKLWLLWKASENRRLSTCYSNTAEALERLGPCGYFVQHSGESLMLPANVPHAALSLTSHYLYGQTFHVRGRAHDPTTFGLELSAHTAPDEAIERVLACYKEGLHDPDLRTRRIHIDRLIYTMSAERIIMRQIGRGSYADRLIGVLKDHRMFQGSCGLCEHFGFAPPSNRDCWEMHDFASERHPSADAPRKFSMKRKNSAISGPAEGSNTFPKGLSMSVGRRS